MDSHNVMVTVCIMTYNHAPYIRECLNSVLEQHRTFSMEVIVNDDCSTDGTTEIIREYENKYPDIIKPVYHDYNLYSTYVKKNRDYYNHIMFPMAKGKYIACCDGDDYWLTQDKLQRQFDFMESNPKYSLCHHNYSILRDGVLIERECHISDRQTLVEAAFSAHIQTTSMFFRNPHCQLVPEDFPFKNTVYQFFWAIRLAEFGDFYYMNEPMSVARQHSEGIFNGTSSHKRFLMSMGNIDNMIKWYSTGKPLPGVVKALKKRGKVMSIPYLLFSIKHFKISDVLLISKWILKYCF